MKKLIYFLSFFLLFAACTEEDLTLTPKGLELESSFYQTEEQLEQAFWAAYDPLQWLVWGNNPYLWGSIGSDDSYAAGADASDQDSYQLFDTYNLTPVEAGDPNMMQLWRANFRMNYRSNLIIKYSDDATTSGKNANGHAYFLKGYAYFQMTRMWGGLPIVDIVPGPDDKFARATQEKTWEAIEGYFIKAAERLPAKISLTDNARGIATKASAQFLLGKSYLYQGKYQDAIEVLEEIAASPYYALEDSFKNVFYPGNRYGKESIFEINFSNLNPPGGTDWDEKMAGNAAYTLIGPRSGEVALGDWAEYEWGWGFNQPTKSLVDAFMAENDTERLHSTIIFSDTIRANNPSITLQNEFDGFWDRKHVRIKGFFNGSTAVNQNSVVLRLADVYLMLAEAYNKTGQDTKALEYLNRVRLRAKLPNATGSGAALLEKIKLERRLELALEGDRYYDLVRWGDAATVLGPLGYDNGTPGVKTNGLLPIPYEEIVASQGENQLEQNEGY